MCITVSDTLSEAITEAIRQGLKIHDGPYVDISLKKPLNVCSRDDTGQIVAGLTAITWENWLNIEFLWVADSQRGSGLGRRVMLAAEAEAMARGCRYARLDTFSFQARPFYERLGYQLQMTLQDYPREHECYFLTKKLG